MSADLETFNVGNYRVRIGYDPDSESSNPRGDELDRFGTFAAWIRNSTLGDENPRISPEEFILRNLVNNFEIPSGARLYEYAEHAIEYGSSDEKRDKHVKQRARAAVADFLATHYEIVNVYVYEHGSIALSTGPFSCPWDSGLAGFVYVTLDEARRAFDSTAQHWTPELRERVRSAVAADMRALAQWANGEVYCYEIERRSTCPHCGETKTETIDSCFGFFDLNECRRQVRDAAESLEKAKR